MAEKIIMPKFGWMMTEGTIVKWYKQEGDFVAEGDVLFEVTTDKSVMDVESPYEGYLVKILVGEGDTRLIGETVAYVGRKNEVVLYEKNINEVKESEIVYRESDVVEKDAIVESEKIMATPAAKRVAKENKIDLQYAFIGIDKVIKVKDVENLIAKGSVKITPLAKKMVQENGIDYYEIKGSGTHGKIIAQDVKREICAKANYTDVSTGMPISGMRDVIADRMLKSSQTTAPVLYVKKMNMEGVLAIKDILKLRAEQENIKITVTDIIIKLVSYGLSKYRNINATFVDNIINESENINIGIAVALEKGLLVPVIEDSNTKSIIEIAKERNSIVIDARCGKLRGEGKGTFTITNLGSYDIDFFTPIIDIPQVAILGIGKINDEVVVVNNEINIRPMAYFSLVADHRVIDGAPAAEFLSFLNEILENPIRYIV